MNKRLLPTYVELERILNETTLKLHPSQVHGLVCGLLAGSLKGHAAWETLITGGEKSAKTHDVLQQLYEGSNKQLQDFLFDFQLLLPPDTEKLSARAEALTLWCQGLLTGLKLAEVPIVDRENSETTEIINDLIEIAKMDYEEVAADEEDESAYAELVEYVRMGVILVYQNLRESDASHKNNRSNPHLH